MHARFASFAPLFSAFSDAGCQLFFVGGCVRDVVMGREQIGDIDLATDARPEKTIEVLRGAGLKAFPIGEKFGTITTLVDGATVEITTFRVGEVYARGSRHPVVTFGDDLAQDLERRDLSMNAMAMDAAGTIHDPFDGRRAIEERVLEVPRGGYENTLSILADDPLRLLRIARFASRFAFLPTEPTTQAASETAEELLHISRERWKMELDKLLEEPFADVGLRWLADVGALAVVLPCAVGATAARIDFVLSAVMEAPRSRGVRWATLLLALTGPADRMAADAEWEPAETRALLAKETAEEFRFSIKERRGLIALAGDLALARDAVRPDAPLPWLRRFYAADPLLATDRIAVARALSHRDPALVAECDAMQRNVDALVAVEDPVPRLPTGLGNVLRDTLSLRGPAIGEALQRVRDAIFDGDVPNGGDAETYLALFD